MPEVIVRHATIEDEEELFDLYTAVLRESMLRIYPYSYQKMLAGIQKSTRKQGGIMGVIDAPHTVGRIAGVVSLYLDQFWWSECTFLMLRDCYVRREYRRGTGYFEALRKFAEDIRKSCDNAKPGGHPPVVLESSFGDDNPKRQMLMERLYRRWGRKVGAVYLSGL